ncbi:MAG: glycoside hydrolase family 19 protein [Bacteroidia bacterium]
MANISQYPVAAVGAAVAALKKYGITNIELQAAILATIAKESAFVPKSELSYATTSNERIRTIFKTRVAALSDAQLTTLKKDPIAFFDHLYGNRYGNNNKGDGYKYRGRGLNQITFRDNYKWIGDMIGVDLVNYPDKLNDVEVAAAAAAVYFVRFFKDGKASGKLKSKLGINDVSEIKDTTTAVRATIMANAGWNTNFNTPVVQEGYKKALEAVGDFKKKLSETLQAVSKTVSENKGATGALILFFLGL